MVDPERKCAMLKKIVRDVNNCDHCEVGRIENKRIGYKLPFDLNHADSEVMFIGICPGVSWVKKEKPLPVRRSDFIKFLQEKVGINEESFYGTNIVKCSCSNSNGKNRNPIVSEILNCSRFLQREIEIIKPKLIVTIGRIPAEYFEIKDLGTQMKKNGIELLSSRHYSNQRNGSDELKKQMQKVKIIMEKIVTR